MKAYILKNSGGKLVLQYNKVTDAEIYGYKTKGWANKAAKRIGATVAEITIPDGTETHNLQEAIYRATR